MKSIHKKECVELKVKIKSLAEEARIIRKEENKLKKVDFEKRNTYTYESLHRHRTYNVRCAARETHLAYAYILGKSYSDIEQNPKTQPNWKAVEKMVNRYGSRLLVQGLENWYKNKLTEAA